MSFLLKKTPKIIYILSILIKQGKRVFVGDSRVGLIYEIAMADLDTAVEASSIKNKTWDVGQKAQRSSSYISEFVYSLLILLG